jgi:hypothetical protein
VDSSGSTADESFPDRLPRDFSPVKQELSFESAASVDSGKDASEPQKSGWDIDGTAKGMLLLNLGALLFGANQVVIKTTEEALSPVALDALRFGIAALCFVPLLPRAFKQPKMLLPALELGFWLTGANALCSQGVPAGRRSRYR